MRARTGLFGSLAGTLIGAVALASAGVESIQGFHRVSDRAAIGGQPKPEQVKALGDAGFNGIINLREESEFDDGLLSHAARDSGVQFFRIPVSRENPSEAAVDKFLAVTDDDALYPIFVYCASGNRAAALWMIRRVLRDGWTLAKAESEAGRVGLTSEKMRDFARDYVHRHAAKGGAGR